MKTILNILIFLVLAISSNAQTRKLKNYYKFVNKAELAICDSNIKAAAKYYKKAFTYKSNPFGKDLENALTAEYKTNCNEQNILNYLSLLKKKRDKVEIPSYIIKKDSLKWQAIEDKANLVSCNPITEVKSTLDSLIKWDRDARMSCRDKSIEWSVQTRRKQDSINIIHLKNLYNKYTNININEESYGSTQFSFVIYILQLHFGEWYYFDLDDLLLNEVYKGNFDARQYANMMDHHEDEKGDMDTLNRKPYAKYGTMANWIINSKLLIYTFEDPTESCKDSRKTARDINKNRKKIFLMPLNDYAKTTVFQYYSKCYDKDRNEFNISFLSIIEGMEKLAFEKLLKTHKIYESKCW